MEIVHIEAFLLIMLSVENIKNGRSQWAGLKAMYLVRSMERAKQCTQTHIHVFGKCATLVIYFCHRRR
jgi:hypothetical protein